MAYTNLGNGFYRDDAGKLYQPDDDGYQGVNDPNTGFAAFAPGFAAPDSYGAVSRARDITNDPRLGTVMGTRGDDNEYYAYNGQRLTRYDPDYWTKKTFYGGLEEPARQAGLNNIVKIGNQYYVPQAAYDQSQAAMFPYSNKANESGFDKFMEGLFQSGPMIASAAFLGPAIAGAMGGAGAGLGAGLAEGTAAGLAGAGESIMAGGYGANLAASGAGFGAGATGLSLAELGAGSLLGGGAGSVLAGGAGALGLSAETVAAMQALGYSGAQIASMGGNALNGFNATQALSAGGSAGGSLSVFDKFLNGILNDPIKAAMSAGQILSGISTANRAMSPQQAQAMADPFSPYRQQYINQLNAVMANPALAMSQPGYQFQRQQGEQAIDRKLASRGMGSYTPDGRGSASGGADIARMKYGQEYALGSYNDYVKQLAGLAGATQAPGVGGQAALSAQSAAARAATEGWTAINQGIGTMQGIMKAAPSGNPNNSGWSAPTTPGAVGESIMASGYGANLAASNPWSGARYEGFGVWPLDNPAPIATNPAPIATLDNSVPIASWYTDPTSPIRGSGYDIGWD